MIYFVTKRASHHKVQFNDEILYECAIEKVIDYCKSLETIGYDLETSGLDPYKSKDFLIILGDKENQFVIDSESFLKEEIINMFQEIGIEKQYLGQNIKFDYRFTKIHYGIELRNLYDTMIVEQRLLQGADDTYHNLVDIIKRRLKILPVEMNKDIRMEFVGKDRSYFEYNNSHISYAAGDIKYLFDLKEIQKDLIVKAKQEFLIYGIEFPLIPILADCELEGFLLDEEKWKIIISDNKEKKFKYQLLLDQEVKKLREELCEEKDKIYLSGGKFDRVRNKALAPVQFDLFGEPKEKEEVDNKVAYINYGSTDQLINIFGRLKQPLPTDMNSYEIPQFIKSHKGKEVVNKVGTKFTTGEAVMEGYLIENPNSPVKTFIKHLIEYREASTRINTFGFKFLKNFTNKVTKKVHTIYRQCTAVTSRLQSGDKDNGWYNAQNIPAEKRYRECFGTDPGYLIATTDLSGAEAVIMIDKAKDERFYEMAIVNDDAHSPLCQAVWRRIGEYRKDQVERIIYGEEIHESDYNYPNYIKRLKEAEDLSKIVISGTENKDIRTAFKPMTFGSIYGMHDKKTAKTLNISIEEAKIGLKVIKSMIPKTFRMVESNARFAITNGYLILNERTNSRIWYSKVFESKKNNSQLSFMDEQEINSSARNSPVQGTQADMVKEMMVEIDKEIRRQKIDAYLLGQVHDELIYKFNEKHLSPTIEYIDEKGSISFVDFGEFKRLTMCKVANRYLSYIKMNAKQHIGKTWTK